MYWSASFSGSFKRHTRSDALAVQLTTRCSVDFPTRDQRNTKFGEELITCRTPGGSAINTTSRFYSKSLTAFSIAAYFLYRLL
jgi:hypothetical protein